MWRTLYIVNRFEKLHLSFLEMFRRSSGSSVYNIKKGFV